MFKQLKNKYGDKWHYFVIPTVLEFFIAGLMVFIIYLILS